MYSGEEQGAYECLESLIQGGGRSEVVPEMQQVVPLEGDLSDTTIQGSFGDRHPAQVSDRPDAGPESHQGTLGRHHGHGGRYVLVAFLQNHLQVIVHWQDNEVTGTAKADQWAAQDGLIGGTSRRRSGGISKEIVQERSHGHA